MKSRNSSALAPRIRAIGLTSPRRILRKIPKLATSVERMDTSREIARKPLMIKLTSQARGVESMEREILTTLPMTHIPIPSDLPIAADVSELSKLIRIVRAALRKART